MALQSPQKISGTRDGFHITGDQRSPAKSPTDVDAPYYHGLISSLDILSPETSADLQCPLQSFQINQKFYPPSFHKHHCSICAELVNFAKRTKLQNMKQQGWASTRWRALCPLMTYERGKQPRTSQQEVRPTTAVMWKCHQRRVEC